MKKYLALLMIAASAQAFANPATSRRIYLAKPTEARQCENSALLNLGAAIVELEDATRMDVKSAMVASLKNRVFCAACGCPANKFYIAEIELMDGEVLVTPNEWKSVDPETIVRPSAPTHGSFSIQPIAPSLR